jgi:Tfp pilus assembly protein PilF
MRRGDNAQATVSLEKAKRREPDKASIREALGVAYLRMHRYHEAAAEFEHILAAAPANDYAHYCLARCLDRLGDRRIARGHYKMALWLRPDVTYYQEAVDGLAE